MPELATVIRDATVVADGAFTRVDLGLATDGRIASVAAAGTLDAGDVVDASGLIALPGGMDLHVHINTYFGGTTTRDDFAAGTAAALFGGTTTIAQFAIPRPGEDSLQAVMRTREEARDCVSDYAVHGCVVRETYEESLRQLDGLAAAGVGTLKVFTAYTDVIGLSLPQIERLLVGAARVGMTVFVHAETDALVREGIRDEVDHGHLGPEGHLASRTPNAEADAIRSISALAAATGARVYFVHVSSAESVAALAGLRAEGATVLAETCPHYLFLDASVYERTDGQRWICSPPIRAARHRDALWGALADGVLDTVSSDHNCFDLAQKGPAGTDFRSVPNGLPGIEHRLPLLVGAALDGRLAWRRMVQASSETPARILGLWPRKGSLSAGSDADIVLADPAGTTRLGAAHMATDYSPYAGMSSWGRIAAVWRRGSLVVRGGELLAEPGSGRWQPVSATPAVRA